MPAVPALLIGVSENPLGDRPIGGIGLNDRFNETLTDPPSLLTRLDLDVLLEVVGSAHNVEDRRRCGVVNCQGAHRYRKERKSLIAVRVQPVENLTVFFPELLCDPDDNRRFETGCINKRLTEVIVVGLLKLILDRNSATVRVTGLDVPVTDRSCEFIEGEDEADSGRLLALRLREAGLI